MKFSETVELLTRELKLPSNSSVSIPLHDSLWGIWKDAYRFKPGRVYVWVGAGYAYLFSPTGGSDYEVRYVVFKHPQGDAEHRRKLQARLDTSRVSGFLLGSVPRELLGLVEDTGNAGHEDYRHYDFPTSEWDFEARSQSAGPKYIAELDPVTLLPLGSGDCLLPSTPLHLPSC